MKYLSDQILEKDNSINYYFNTSADDCYLHVNMKTQGTFAKGNETLKTCTFYSNLFLFILIQLTEQVTIW